MTIMKLFNKKADFELSLTTIVVMILTVVILLGLFYISAKLLGIFRSEKDESTIRNFEMLAATIIQMEESTSLTNYPIYIKKDYAVVGYQSGVSVTGTRSAIGGTCTTYTIFSPYENKKPEQCGVGEEGCLCLCKKTDAFATLCQENDEVIACKTTTDFGKDLSFTGGIFSDGSGKCDFALIYGSDQPQTIYVKKSEETVRICTQECVPVSS